MMASEDASSNRRTEANSTLGFGMIVGFFPAVVVFVGSGVLALFSMRWATVAYVSLIYLGLGIIMLGLFSVRPKDNGWVFILSQDDQVGLQWHYLFFRFPAAAAIFTHFLNFARAFGLIWIGVSLWQGLYWAAILCALFYLIASNLMVRLSPITHYESAAKKGNRFAIKQLGHIHHVRSMLVNHLDNVSCPRLEVNPNMERVSIHQVFLVVLLAMALPVAASLTGAIYYGYTNGPYRSVLIWAGAWIVGGLFFYRGSFTSAFSDGTYSFAIKVANVIAIIATMGICILIGDSMAYFIVRSIVALRQHHKRMRIADTLPMFFALGHLCSIASVLSRYHGSF